MVHLLGRSASAMSAVQTECYALLEQHHQISTAQELEIVLTTHQTCFTRLSAMQIIIGATQRFIYLRSALAGNPTLESGFQLFYQAHQLPHLHTIALLEPLLRSALNAYLVTHPAIVGHALLAGAISNATADPVALAAKGKPTKTAEEIKNMIKELQQELNDARVKEGLERTFAERALLSKKNKNKIVARS